MTRFEHGLFIGKFYPPRSGHHAAIRTAAAQCRRFSVVVMAAAPETIELAERVGWLRAEHADTPNVTVTGIRCDAPMDITDQQVWAAQVAVMRAAITPGFPPVDAVFCGDDYGDELARWFGATAVRLDRDGASTAVRRDLAGRWHELAPATRAGLTTRVVVVGAESTGTTTIATLLAQHYADRSGNWADTKWVPEYGREHTELKCRQGSKQVGELIWDQTDFDTVATEQTRREEWAARNGSPLLVCDTDAFATTLWERRYLGGAARTGQPWAVLPHRAAYLITDHVGVPWHDDGMREGDLAVRAAMTSWFIDALTAADQSWVLLTGSLDQRLQVAIRTVDQLLTTRMRFGEPLHGPGFEAPDG